MRTILICLLIVAAGALQAFGQVAAPSLLPGTAHVYDPEQFTNLQGGLLDQGPLSEVTFVPTNPAAMQWSDSSEVGVGGARSSAQRLDLPTLLTDHFDYSGDFAGLRWVQPHVSFGVQALKLSGSSVTVPSNDTKLTDIAGAFQLFDRIAFGVNVEKRDQTFYTNVLLQSFSANRKQSTYGTSARLGGGFYAGYSGGTNHMDLIDPVTPSNNTSVRRSTKAYGLGFMNSGANRWHLEVYRTHTDEGTGGSTTLTREDATVGVIEARFGGLVLGLGKVNETTEGTSPGIYKAPFTASQFTVAWVTSGGWTFTGHRDTAKVDDGPSLFKRKVSSTSLSVGHLF
jgi:hypothetical protein